MSDRHARLRITYRLGDGQEGIPITFQEVVHPPSAANVEIHIDTSEVVQHEIPDGIGALNRICVRVEHMQMVRVMRLDELARSLIGPQHVLANCQLCLAPYM